MNCLPVDDEVGVAALGWSFNDRVKAVGCPPRVRTAPRLGDRLCLSRRKSATTAGTPTDQARVCFAAPPPASATLLRYVVRPRRLRRPVMTISELSVG